MTRTDWCLIAMVATALVLGLVRPTPAFLAGDGKGKPDRDCYIGLDGYSSEDLSSISKNGKKQGIACTDCDPACDLDGVDTPNGSCTFSIAACVNNAGVPGCDPATRDPKKVKAQAKSKAGKIDLGTTFPGDLTSACSAFVDFPVPVKGKKLNKPGKGTVTLLAKKKTDKDKFTFVCNPRPEGEACPAPPTTTTTTTVPGSTTTTTIVFCGNGQLEAGEECDDANVDPTDGCTNTCTICGNDVITAPEACDDGNLDPEDGCAANCQPEGCGNGLIETGETCDDGNTDDGDACPSTCVIEFCDPNVGSDFTIDVTFAGSDDVAGITVLLDYPEGQVIVPGSGGQVPSGVITDTPGFALAQPNDLDYALREALVDTFAFPQGLLFRVHLETCMGASLPTAGDFACTVEAAGDVDSVPIEGVTCSVALTP
jgi:cysteine-rich repeat protein